MRTWLFVAHPTPTGFHKVVALMHVDGNSLRSPPVPLVTTRHRHWTPWPPPPVVPQPAPQRAQSGWISQLPHAHWAQRAGPPAPARSRHVHAPGRPPAQRRLQLPRAVALAVFALSFMLQRMFPHALRVTRMGPQCAPRTTVTGPFLHKCVATSHVHLHHLWFSKDRCPGNGSGFPGPERC